MVKEQWSEFNEMLLYHLPSKLIKRNKQSLSIIVAATINTDSNWGFFIYLF